jgi:hypothetical protein
MAVWEDHECGVQISHPRSWSAKVRKTNEHVAGAQILAEFMVSRSAPEYMRMSIAVDDVCWSTNMSPRVYARQVVSQLSNDVPGSHVLRDRQVALSAAARAGAHEVLYTMPDDNDHTLAILNYYFQGNMWAFTVTFACELRVFKRYEALARSLLGSFTVRRRLPPAIAETSTDPKKTAWKTYIFDPIAEVQPDLTSTSARVSSNESSSSCRLIRPSEWQRQEVPNPRVIRFCCARTEQTLKVINYFIVDMSFLGEAGVDELLSELKQFYEQEVCGQGIALTREVQVKAGAVKSGMEGPFCAFQGESRQGFVNVRSRVFLGLHGPNRSVGHIITVSVSSEVFSQFSAFSQHVFREFQKSNG